MISIDYSLLILIALTLAISMFYFYLFVKNKEKYISFWGFSWTIYAVSLVLDVILFNNRSILVLGLKQITDLFGSLFLLFGTYIFIGEKVPNHWIQYSLLNLIWILTGVYYNVSFITITLLPSIYLGILAIFTGITLTRYWEIPSFQKIITGIVFLFWGIHKAYYPYFKPEYWNSPSGYLSEIILANILNFCILMIYLQKIRNELVNSEKRFRLLAENAQDIIYYYRLYPKQGLEFISPSCLNIFGYTPQDFYNDPAFFTKLLHPDDKGLFFNFHNLRELPPNPITLRYLHKNNYYVWTEQKYNFIFDTNNRVSGVEGILRDITERKKAEDDMLQTKKSRQLLLTYISHELRTPITSIIGYVTAMLDGTINKNISPRRSLELIHTKSLMLDRLIKDLFQLTQLESKQFTFNFSQVDILKLLRNIIEKYEWEIIQAGICLTIDFEKISEKKIDVIADIERIDQVIGNFIANSIKNTSTGGNIHITCEIIGEVPESILVKVSDSGIGIRKEDLPFVFDRFFKGKNLEGLASSGSGLGLTISKEIIEAHQGKIWAESKLHKGSTICFTLPIYDEVP